MDFLLHKVKMHYPENYPHSVARLIGMCRIDNSTDVQILIKALDSLEEKDLLLKELSYTGTLHHPAIELQYATVLMSRSLHTNLPEALKVIFDRITQDVFNESLAKW